MSLKVRMGPTQYMRYVDKSFGTRHTSAAPRPPAGALPPPPPGASAPPDPRELAHAGRCPRPRPAGAERERG